MGRDAAIASGNPWYEARKRAAIWNDRLSSRAGAAEMLHVSEDVIDAVERNTYKHMPVETAVAMADVYHQPELLNHYCLHECPIGCHRSLSDEIVDIDRVTVKILKNMRLDVLEDFKNKLLDIAEDGKISAEEVPHLVELNEYLKGLSKTISEINNLTARAVAEDK